MTTESEHWAKGMLKDPIQFVIAPLLDILFRCLKILFHYVLQPWMVMERQPPIWIILTLLSCYCDLENLASDQRQCTRKQTIKAAVQRR
jgi:hypothetical protein